MIFARLTRLNKSRILSLLRQASPPPFSCCRGRDFMILGCAHNLVYYVQAIVPNNIMPANMYTNKKLAPNETARPDPPVCPCPVTELVAVAELLAVAVGLPPLLPLYVTAVGAFVLTVFGRNVVKGAWEMLRLPLPVLSAGIWVAKLGLGLSFELPGDRTLSKTCTTPFESSRSEVRTRAELTKKEFEEKLMVIEPP